jgi:DNA-binding NarL/FixJ family response regulator
LTVFADKEKVFEALDAGAAGYLLKSATQREIVRGVKGVFAGGAALSPEVAQFVLQEMRKPKPTEKFYLSPREVEVLEQLAAGLSVKEIAAELGIARSTAAGHLEKIYEKLSVRSQSGAVAKALRAGII